jgi:ATPase family associated with various cellular activities (AAA)
VTGSLAIEAWEAENNAYLTEALEWLRERLEMSAERQLDSAPAAADVDSAPAAADADDDVAEQWWAHTRWTGAEVPPALELLGHRFGLSRFERLTLLLASSMELDPGMAARFARASNDPSAPFPTLALAVSIIPGAAWDAVSPHRPLRYWRLLELHQGYGEPVMAARIRADERIVGYLKGLNMVDERLGRVVKPAHESLGHPLPPSHVAAVEQIQASVVSDELDDPPIVELVGADPATRRGLAVSAAEQRGMTLYEMHPERAPQSADAVELIRLWQRETMLLPLALYIDVARLRTEELSPLEALLGDLYGVVMVGTREPWTISGRTIRIVDVARPTASEQQELWTRVLGDGDRGAQAAMLSAEFDLGQAAIRDAAELATRRGGDPEALWTACRAQSRPRLDSLAQRIEPVATWDDLVLAEEGLTLLRHLVDQVRGRSTVLRSWGMAERIRRGSAITALFAGPSGTGKTLAAEVLANALRLDLYRIDLAGVVSKYIGETERNLRRVFDAAEEGGALLFFDEADALFGKRSEVKDSHDRYANIEVNYLLQRMEEYGGVAVLASNQRHALDTAFLRRLRFVVPFPFPSPRERALLWARAFPDRAPVRGLDVERLARIAANGGMIRNIALNAAYCAAGRGTEVTMALVLEMSRIEFRKFGLPIDESEFRPDEEPA